MESVDLVIVRNIVQYYSDNVYENLVNQCIHLKYYLLQSKSECYTTCSEIYKLLHAKKFVGVFPNCYNTLKLFFLTLPITGCGAERSFSSMSNIEKRFRTTMSNEQLNYLSILATNCVLTKEFKVDQRIKEFKARKCRKFDL